MFSKNALFALHEVFKEIKGWNDFVGKYPTIANEVIELTRKTYPQLDDIDESDFVETLCDIGICIAYYDDDCFIIDSMIEVFSSIAFFKASKQEIYNSER